MNRRSATRLIGSLVDLVGVSVVADAAVLTDAVDEAAKSQAIANAKDPARPGL